MKKIVMFLFVMAVALSAKAQVYVGGGVSFWNNSDEDKTTFAIAPEVGYNLNKKWAIGGNIGFAYVKMDDAKATSFAIAPYARYSFYENKIVRLFIDGGFGFSTTKVEDEDAITGFEIGLRPGLAIKLNNKFSLITKIGFLGYRDDYMGNAENNGAGLTLSSEDLSLGFHYEF